MLSSFLIEACEHIKNGLIHLRITIQLIKIGFFFFNNYCYYTRAKNTSQKHDTEVDYLCIDWNWGSHNVSTNRTRPALSIFLHQSEWPQGVRMEADSRLKKWCYERRRHCGIHRDMAAVKCMNMQSQPAYYRLQRHYFIQPDRRAEPKRVQTSIRLAITLLPDCKQSFRPSSVTVSCVFAVFALITHKEFYTAVWEKKNL